MWRSNHLSNKPLHLKIYDKDKLKAEFLVSRKEVFQPHLPVRLPCYDLALVAEFTLNRLLPRSSGPPNSHGLTGGVYKVRERIHRAMADARLLAIPASWGRVADPNPNCDRLYKIGSALLHRYPLYRPL